ncbi:hypothetical protein DPMN_141292 [Dreissena polymorpha]|uniref:Uncharacterized protein n=1 Tax=Dreissena polymorpha TaxID=45954 RepID=A0A9D4G946_DREPO|nr:hypothetical protein DPMN_141292 [Dreissena polymorpha]
MLVSYPAGMTPTPVPVKSIFKREPSQAQITYWSPSSVMWGQPDTSNCEQKT